MTDREKLIEILGENISEYCRLSVIAGTAKITGVTLDAYRLADHLIANGVTFAKDTNVPANPVIPGHDDQYNIAEMSYNNGYAKGCEDSKPKWIPVSERLPGVIQPVIVWTKFQEIGEAHYNGKQFQWIDDEGVYDYAYVTHWMPLPEPPKEDTVKP